MTNADTNHYLDQQDDPTKLQTPLIKDGWLRALAYFFAFFVASGVFSALGAGSLVLFGVCTFQELETLLGNSSEMNLGMLTYLQFTGLLGTLLITWLFRRFMDLKSFESLGFNWQGMAKDAALGFFLGIVLIGGGFVILLLLGNLSVTGITFDWSSLLLSFLLMVIVAINEEVMVRGYILNNLMESMNKYKALLVSAAIFSFLHFLNPNISVVGAINIVLAGLLLGVYYIHVKNLWFPIMLHLSWNFFQGPVLGFEVSGLDLQGIVGQSVSGNTLLTGGDFGFEGSLLLTALMVGAIAWVDLRYSKPVVD